MSQVTDSHRRRDKFFVGFGRLGIRWPVTISVVLALLTDRWIFFASQLTIKTSRVGLVDADNWYQRRMSRSSTSLDIQTRRWRSSRAARRPTATRSSTGWRPRSRQESVSAAGCWRRLGAKDIAETLLVQAPGQLARFRQQPAPDTDLARPRSSAGSQGCLV